MLTAQGTNAVNKVREEFVLIEECHKELTAIEDITNFIRNPVEPKEHPDSKTLPSTPLLKQLRDLLAHIKNLRESY